MKGTADAATRTLLTSSLTFYVRLDGSDTNSGLEDTPNRAFRSIQKAIETTYRTLDLNGYQVLIQLGPGTHTAPVKLTGRPIGAHGSDRQPLRLIGDETTPSNVQLQVTGETAVNLGQGAYLLIAGVRIGTSAAGHGCMVSRSTLEHRNCEFGDVAQDMILVTNHGFIKALGPLDVLGNARSFVHATARSLVDFSDQKIGFHGNSFGTYVWGLNDASVTLENCLICGPRPLGYTRVHDHSLLNTYRSRNPDGWGFLGAGDYAIEDGSCVTADGYRLHRFYVRSDAAGDQNDGLENTRERAFKSIQACLDHVAGLPFNPAAFYPGSGVVISIGDGTYDGVHLWDLKYFDATLEGNVAEPHKVTIAAAENAVIAAGRTKWTIKGCKLSAGIGACIRAKRGAQLDYDCIEFASAAEYHVLALHGAVVVQTGDCLISGSAVAHIASLYGSTVDISGRKLSLSGRPAFADAFLRSRNNSLVRAVGTIFEGSAVGRRFHVSFNATIDVGGAGKRALPGTSGGSTGPRHARGQYG